MIRTRFAPSPTGLLHIGNLRTALYAWLFARHYDGKFILRIEDTDLERSTEDATKVILDCMQWLSLNCDEGPFYQTKRFDRYNEVIQQLLDTGNAYRCYCTKERLQKLREEQLSRKEKPRYDGRCRDLKIVPEGDFVIRFRNPDSGAVSFDDQIKGVIEFQNSELDDLIIARSDGSPTYNLTVVVDDLDMKITHAIRGDGHINNTPRQINIFKAIGAEPPIYAHTPMILGEDGKLLSKRHGSVSVVQYREDGILPKALLNYIVRLGWSHGDQEIFSLKEMIEFFDLSHLSKSPATFNTEKLLWLNQHYLKTLPPKDIEPELKWQMERQKIDITSGPKLTEIITAQAERCKTLKEMAEKSVFFYKDFTYYDEKAARKNLKPESADVLQLLYDQFKSLNDWQADKLHQIVVDVAEKKQLKLGKVAQPLRVAATGGSISPPIDITLQLIGKKKVLNRTVMAIDFITAQ